MTSNAIKNKAPIMLKDRITEDLKKAMKEGNEFRLGVLRLLSSAVHNREIEKRAGKEVELSDSEVIDVLSKEAKKRKEAALLFRKGKRIDLAEKEERELKIVEQYLPAQADVEEIRTIVRALHAAGQNEFATLMREAMKQLKGRAPGDAVVSVVKEEL